MLGEVIKLLPLSVKGRSESGMTANCLATR
jgi:hypothetical protein